MPNCPNTEYQTPNTNIVRAVSHCSAKSGIRQGTAMFLQGDGVKCVSRTVENKLNMRMNFQIVKASKLM